MRFITLLIAFVLVNFVSSTASSVSMTCDPGEDTCSTCYDLLVNELVVSDRNRFNLQKAFFPPGTSNPVFVTVRYHFIRNATGPLLNTLTGGGMQTWFWTESTFYLFQPIESFQFTSLLFADTTLSSSDEVDLYLQPECNESSSEMMRLLTQRLKIYASERKVSASIPNDYGAKGESLDTLLSFHNGTSVYRGNFLSPYTFGFHIFYPIIVAVFIGFFVLTLIANDKHSFAEIRAIFESGKPAKTEDPKKDKKEVIDKLDHSHKNMRIYMVSISCYLFVVYVIILDLVAVARRSMVKEEIFHNPAESSTNHAEPLRLEYGIPLLLFSEDLIVFVLLIIGGIIKICPRSRDHFTWYYVLFGPGMCIIIHSYHILIGFIHTPHHATSVLVFYGLIILFYTIVLKTFYYTFSHCCAQLYKRNRLKKEEKSRTGKGSEQLTDEQIESQSTTTSEKTTTNKCDVNETETEGESQTGEGSVQQTGEQNQSTATSQSDQSRRENSTPLSESKSPQESIAVKMPDENSNIKVGIHVIKFIGLFSIAVILALLLVFLVYLFVLVPINNAIDDAPNRIITINQTVLIIIGVLITFKVFDMKKGGNSYLDYLVKAKNKQERKDKEQKDEHKEDKKWKEKSPDEKREEVAGKILEYYKIK